MTLVLFLKGSKWFSFLTSDFDECSLEPSPCDDNADCTNTAGSYSCTCKEGFAGNGAICEGVRMWKTIHCFFIADSLSRLCRVVHYTKRHFHFYRLFCLKRSSCVLYDSHICPSRQQCTQSTQLILLVLHETETFSFVSLWSPSIILHTLSWYYDAECYPMPPVAFLHYRSIDKGTFTVQDELKGTFILDTQNNIWLIYFSPDVNECSADSKPCDDNADCSNTEGSYSCRCKSGFTGNGKTCQGSEYLTIRKAVSLLANVHVILGVEVCSLYFRKNFVQRRRKKDRLQESHVFNSYST